MKENWPIWHKTTTQVLSGAFKWGGQLCIGFDPPFRENCTFWVFYDKTYLVHLIKTWDESWHKVQKMLSRPFAVGSFFKGKSSEKKQDNFFLLLKLGGRNA